MKHIEGLHEFKYALLVALLFITLSSTFSSFSSVSINPGIQYVSTAKTGQLSNAISGTFTIDSLVPGNLILIEVYIKQNNSQIVSIISDAMAFQDVYIFENASSISPIRQEFWYTFTQASGTSTITVTLSSRTTAFGVIASSYTNVKAVGRSNTLSGSKSPPGNSFTLIINPFNVTRAQNWLAGGATANINSIPLPNIPGQIQRNGDGNTISADEEDYGPLGVANYGWSEKFFIGGSYVASMIVIELLTAPSTTSPTNPLNNAQCLSSPNFIITTGLFECAQDTTDYGVFMFNWPCGQLISEWILPGNTGFSNGQSSVSGTSFAGYMVGAVNSTGILILGLGVTSGSCPTPTAVTGCTQFFTFTTKSWGSRDCNFTGIAPAFPSRGYDLQMLNSTAYIVTVIGSDTCIYSKIDNHGVDGSYVSSGLCNNTSFNVPALNAVPIEMISSVTGFSVSLTTSLTVITGTEVPVDISQFLNFKIYATYSNALGNVTFQLQAANCPTSSCTPFWSNLGNPCTFPASATTTFAECDYQVVPNAFSTAEVLLRMEAKSGVAATMMLFNLGVEFHT